MTLDWSVWSVAVLPLAIFAVVLVTLLAATLVATAVSAV
jgi:hypothetical protein